MKIGDKLRVKMGLEHDQECGINFYRDDMRKGGEIVTLKEYNKECGWVTEECNIYHYTVEMLEPISENSLKIGDKLKIKMGLESNGLYGENYYRNDMFKGGEIVTLKEYNEDSGWLIEENSPFSYTPEMLEPLNKNYLHEAVKSFMADNGLEVGEEFRIKEPSMENMYILDEDYVLKYNYAEETKYIASGKLPLLLEGKLEIIKTPWKPTVEYYHNSPTGVYSIDMNNQYCINLFNMQQKNYHKTKEEAIADRPRMLQVFKGIEDDFNKL